MGWRYITSKWIRQRHGISRGQAGPVSDVRYRGGAASYLEVLTNETNAFNAELGLADAQFVELLSLVEIYRNLGGGWES